MNSGVGPMSGTGRPMVTAAEAQRDGKRLRVGNDWASEHCKQAVNLDYNAPFASTDDAIDRLLPFHVFASEEGDEADLDETPDGEGKGLLTSRMQAWLDMCERKAVEFTRTFQGHIERFDKMEGRVAKTEGLRAEENYQVARILLDDERTRHREHLRQLEAQRQAAREKAMAEHEARRQAQQAAAAQQAAQAAAANPGGVPGVGVGGGLASVPPR